MYDHNFRASDSVITNTQLLSNNDVRHLFNSNAAFYRRHARLMPQHFEVQTHEALTYFGFECTASGLYQHRLFSDLFVHVGEMTVPQIGFPQNTLRLTWGKAIWNIRDHYQLIHADEYLHLDLPPLVFRNNPNDALQIAPQANVLCRTADNNEILHYGVHQLGYKYQKQGVWKSNGKDGNRIHLVSSSLSNETTLTTNLDNNPKKFFFPNPTLTEIIECLISNT